MSRCPGEKRRQCAAPHTVTTQLAAGGRSPSPKSCMASDQVSLDPQSAVVRPQLVLDLIDEALRSGFLDYLGRPGTQP